MIAIWEFEEAGAEKNKNTKKSEDYAGMGQGDELCKRNTKRLG